MSKYDTYDLFESLDEYLTRPKLLTRPESEHFYPSEASVVTYDEHGDQVIHGKCMRAAYFRLANGFKSAPFEPYSEYIFMLGKIVENQLINYWKEMGIWYDNNVKFYDKENNISGELDVILVEPGTGQMYIGEVKTFYGYMAEKEIFGSKTDKPFPKMNNLLQTLVYLNHFKDTFPYARIIYFARDSGKRRTFKIELEQEGNILYPKVEGEIIRSFSIQDILARYKELEHYLKTNTIPKNDFELYYDDAKIEDFYQKGKVAKTKYQKYKTGKLHSNEKIGDWNCRYCNFSQICWDK